MVTYQIQIPESKKEAFLEMLQSLARLGIVSSFKLSDNVVQPGAALDDEALLSMLQTSEKEVAEGQVFTGQEAVEFIKAWRQRKK